MKPSSLCAALAATALTACSPDASSASPASPPPSALTAPSDAVDIDLYLFPNEWWQSLNDHQRTSMDATAQDLCDALDNHITYGEIDDQAGTQSVRYNAQAIVLELEHMRLAMYEHGSGSPDSSDLEDLAAAAVQVHCGQHTQILEEVFDDYMPEINEFWDERLPSADE